MADYVSKYGSGAAVDAQLDAATHPNRDAIDSITATKIATWDNADEVIKWFNAVIKPTLSDGKLYLIRNGVLVEITGGAVWTNQ